MQFKNLDLNLLHMLDVLFEERSVSRAATKLEVTQPAVSTALAKLRNRFGDDLFIRSPSGLVPTAFAEAIRKPVREVLDSIDRDILHDQPFVPGTTKRDFVVATSDFGEAILLPELLKFLSVQAPNCAIFCVSQPPTLLAESMERGEVDLAVGYFPDLERNLFHSFPFGSARFGCIARKGHPFIDGSLTLEQFERAGHVVITHETRQQDAYENFIKQKRIQRRVHAQVAHMMSIIPVVEHTDLISAVPWRLGKMSAKVQLLELPFDVKMMGPMMYWHHRRNSDPAVMWLRNIVKTINMVKVNPIGFRPI